jgi:Rps23 Pro-64 3,4-dihydroxylase Tpa1-like proline 4-hydroxylase
MSFGGSVGQSSSSAERAGEIALAPHHDVTAYAAAYAATGRVHIRNLLRESDAQRLHEALAKRVPWHIHVIHNGLRQIPLEQWEAIPAGQKLALEAALAEGARTPLRFEARYLTAHLSIDGEPYEDDPDLGALVRFLNSEAFLDFARAVTGDATISLTDAHASCYRAGDFLHRHNDHAGEAARVAAYVLNLTPAWCAEWGGLLNFLGRDGNVAEAFTPAWNALNFLKVPQDHFVGAVAGFVAEKRLSFSGWVRRN